MSVKPIAQEIDENHRFPVELLQRCKTWILGYTLFKGVWWTRLRFFTYVLAMERNSKVCTTTASIPSAHTSLAAMPIDVFGTIEQKRNFYDH